MTKTVRRTQQMRSEATQRKLVEAALDAMMETGYTRMTTAEVAARAGVSRGALMHHFATKDDLVATAVEAQLTESTEDIRAQAARVRAGELDLNGFVEHVWGLFSGRLFYITLEHVTEARHNADLRAKMIPVVKRFHEALDEIWREFFHQTTLTSIEVDTTLNMTLCLLRGMGVQTVLRNDPPYYQRLLDGWKAQLSRIIEAESHGGEGKRAQGVRENGPNGPKEGVI
ncbi:TetR/AcrR family transcriptional regulator [Kaustia mangrovi]|uniref:TetR/AcrR family transcriptional regulator n=1 Tax=Kaustia mangrovi TaxID=2593653 RepID=A0A7S8HCY7_9HYPH|nr:TetR/AcrR family transcriptional regulator [Kaustia mangrovi]QPC44217.1 TetR/AcrR family transcriptional regulator [Kaustia mangrovi]